MQKLVTPAEVPPKGVPAKVIRSASAGSELLVGQQTIYEMLQYDRLNSSYGPNLYLILTSGVQTGTLKCSTQKGPV